MATPLIIVGAGMHGRVIHDLAISIGRSVEGFLDDTGGREEKTTTLPILGTTDLLQDPELLECFEFAVAIGNNLARRRISLRIRENLAKTPTLTHPSCWISPSVKIGVGNVIVGQNMIFSNARIGDDVLIDPSSTIGADSVIKNGTYICPGVNLGARVICEENCFIGIGAKVLPEISIGANSIVGAGAVVTRNVEPRTMVVGSPARDAGAAQVDDSSPYPARRIKR